MNILPLEALLSTLKAERISRSSHEDSKTSRFAASLSPIKIGSKYLVIDGNCSTLSVSLFFSLSFLAEL